jgi:hypothetical protein
VLGPLVDRNSFEMEIAIHKQIYPQAWGSSPSNYSRGFFPAEMAFSEKMIPSLVKAGIEWVMVPNNHFSRACQDYPYVPVLGGVLAFLVFLRMLLQPVPLLARSPRSHRLVVR